MKKIYWGNFEKFLGKISQIILLLENLKYFFTTDRSVVEMLLTLISSSSVCFVNSLSQAQSGLIKEFKHGKVETG